ncbi:T7SS effector LXG polymorphic toxin [Lentibacillus sp. N15]|uniref:T7SS effector LXG polymorphic toxin n=1 Tax=Lentibacillus songyuanensis TaxID=3136161 RepID=UPI0031BA41C5
MGNKVDISEVHTFCDDLETTSSSIKSSLDSIKADIDRMNAMESFSGQAATEAKGYFKEFHKTVLEAFNGLFHDLNKNVKQHLTTFEAEVDTSESAIVESDYLNNPESKVDKKYAQLEFEYQSINRTINDVSDISSATTPSFSSVKNNESTVIETIIDLEDKLSSFTSEGKEHDSETKELLHHLEVAVNSAGTKNGRERFTDFTTVTAYVGLPVLKDHNNSSTEEKEKFEKLDKESRDIIKKAEEDYKDGEIDKTTFDSIYTGVLHVGARYIQSLVSSKVQQEVTDRTAASMVNWAHKNIGQFFVDPGLRASLANGSGGITIAKEADGLSKVLRTGARNGIPIVGSAIDFGIQIYQGEDATDAALKTAGHMSAGAVGAAIGSVVPFAGTAIGFGVGVGLSMAFDWGYDHADEIVEGAKNITKKVTKKVGDAVSGFFGNLGSVFG